MTTTTAVAAQQAYVQKELNQLLDGKIIAVGAVVEDDFGSPIVWPVLNILLPNGRTLEISVSRDEEGNGPGHLFIGEI